MSDAIQNNPSDWIKMTQNVEGKDGFQFFLCLCHDVLFEALLFGDRRRLTKFERIGRYFHTMIENFFKQMPFLRLCLKIDPSNKDIFVITGLVHEQIISFTEMTTIPPFVRLKDVELWYMKDFQQPIEEKCAFIENRLLPFQSALNDSNMIECYARIRIDQYRDDFNDHLGFIEYIRNRMLPICNSSRGYKFFIIFESDVNSGTNVIASLLQMAEIKRCPNVEINLCIPWECQNQLPVEEISNWLERSADDVGNYIQNKKERFLTVKLFASNHHFFQNVREILDQLKTKFVEAECSVHPFTFIVGGCEVKELALGIEAETVASQKTDEQLSIIVLERRIEIKRARKKKTNKKNSAANTMN